MSDETIAIVYSFLSTKDNTCAEIFKRSFAPNLDCAKELPNLDEIVKFYIKMNKKPEPKKRNTELHSHEALKSAIKIESSSDFLTKLVHKRFEGTCDSSSESDVEEISSQSTTDSDDNHVQVSASKRKRTTNGFQSMYNETKKTEKNKEKAGKKAGNAVKNAAANQKKEGRRGTARSAK